MVGVWKRDVVVEGVVRNVRVRFLGIIGEEWDVVVVFVGG